jgi:hypothetical protein
MFIEQQFYTLSASAIATTTAAAAQVSSSPDK